MRRSVFVLLFLLGGLLIRPIAARCQADEIAQLLLNVEKLSQLKSILDNMYKGYDILSKGYNTIKGIAEGNFSMHDIFLKGLLKVSPTVAKYWKVGDIISRQQQVMAAYKRAWEVFRSANIFTPDQLEYLHQVYASLADKTVDNLEDLLMYITSDRLRMSDDERLSGIDRVKTAMDDQYNFITSFNRSTASMLVNRIKATGDIQLLMRLHAVN
ncbi:uncharacterized protein (UPF0297 family) [Chitinophaga terrae (ex Kim and Jung 2007)]|uniref:TerB family tellurite resistance protein n=1 Tax=Chitinophaga terrae (ex Kim and Jung 2007) TaxID=408074 RepID=UPI002787B08B|nr:TerB family tellurite resistance protein [Chitinophaga terrae (ex Kim and Jung 2007)]MDQ0107463.1 uncharacterized protein (UPF0297 family) [Chitinophaga terrae (ex Kim and Jung 2007)]